MAATEKLHTMTLRKSAQPITGVANNYDRLIGRIGTARFVLIGEATHGTHEFFQQRAEITKRLIQEKGFHAVAVEADWPDAYRINRYVRGWDKAAGPLEALEAFKRFPTWMWRNTVVLNFMAWLRQHNDAQGLHKKKVGF